MGIHITQGDVYEVLLETKGESEAVLFARSATTGCQQFPVHWGGTAYLINIGRYIKNQIPCNTYVYHST